MTLAYSQGRWTFSKELMPCRVGRCALERDTKSTVAGTRWINSRCSLGVTGAFTFLLGHLMVYLVSWNGVKISGWFFNLPLPNSLPNGKADLIPPPTAPDPSHFLGKMIGNAASHLALSAEGQAGLCWQPFQWNQLNQRTECISCFDIFKTKSVSPVTCFAQHFGQTLTGISDSNKWPI